MTGNWMETMQQALSGPVADRLGEWTGMSAENTRHVVQSAVPLSVASLAHSVTTPEAADGLLDAFRSGAVEQLDGDGLTSTIGEPGGLDRMSQRGGRLIGRIFHGDLGGITDALAGHLGVGREGIGKILPLIGTFLMGSLAKIVIGRGMDSGGLLAFLREHGRMAAGMLPGPLARLVGGGRTFESPIPREGPVAREIAPRAIVEEPRRERKGLPGWLPAVLAGVAAVCLIAILLSSRRPQVEKPRVATPAATDVQRVAGRTPSFSEFLASSSSAPWIVGGLEFETDSERIVPTTRAILDDVAGGLAASSATRIKVIGHTDSTGDAQANRDLSLRRAEAVKAYLVEKGVPAGRIETAGMGADQPLAPNDTEEGRKQNRRTEILVMK
jgi:outer membrane protein OmpA-like peptidoglycan-associated protein